MKKEINVIITYLMRLEFLNEKIVKLHVILERFQEEIYVHYV